ncbi:MULTISPECIES: hypothetical protein [Halolamina]|uniref:Uncharacterized protein n=1 Tax=Halolamina pelagica TaxID=699431 RepID=A0A1I5TGG5_9EURY|nr:MULTISPECIES: hypothetical protein [Halolamina]NHX37338.1 histidine kinase [Halolamina sp. R1-12]SFP82123.1 hypothetical protein SAMN05216277_10972 [Halolamina pelagica]
MNSKLIVGALGALLLLSVVAMPAAAAPGAVDGPAEQVNDCENAENGPDGDGPPGFVADLVPDFVSGLMGDLPVPNFVKSAFGAETC